MATEQQVQESIARVRAGTANAIDVERVEKRSHVAGSSGNQAREAMKNSGK